MICVNKMNRKEQQTKTRGQVSSLTTQEDKKKDVGDGSESTSIRGGVGQVKRWKPELPTRLLGGL